MSVVIHVEFFLRSEIVLVSNCMHLKKLSTFIIFLFPVDTVRSHIGWRGEWNIPYKGVETSL